MLDADAAYLERYGLVEPPFLGAPDARFTYRSASLTHAVAVVLERVAHGDRVIGVIGDPGIGKTTLCMELSRYFATDASALREYDVRVVDDAHLLDVERLRDHLANARSGECRRQTILVGEAQLEELLQQAGSAGDGIHRIRLGPLDEREIVEYIERRMWVARGGVERFRASTCVDGAGSGADFMRGPRFSARAVRRLAAATNGNPRAINVVCAQTLNAPPSFFPLRRMAWSAIAAGLVALAMMPTVYSKREPVRAASPVLESAGSFDRFRTITLQQAAELAAVPNVKELLRVRDGVLSRTRQSSDPPQAVTDLLKEIDRLTNVARARQLELDHRQMLEYAKQH